MQNFTVKIDDFEIRLDRYIKKYIKNLSQGVIEKALRKGHIKLNNKKTKASAQLNDGDNISIAPSIISIVIKQNNNNEFVYNAQLAKLISKNIIIEDDNLLIINKPAGLAAQGGTNISRSVDEALKHYYYQKDIQARLTHRLDRATSGIMIIAKNHQAAIKITQAFKDKKIQKKYLALTFGKLEHKTGLIDNLISAKKTEPAKQAKTEFKLLATNKSLNLLEFTPLTGRMHQLRIHAAKHLKTPIINDEIYNPHKLKLQIGNNMFLHASSITLSADIIGKSYEVIAPLPDYFHAVLKQYNLSIS